LNLFSINFTDAPVHHFVSPHISLLTTWWTEHAVKSIQEDHHYQ